MTYGVYLLSTTSFMNIFSCVSINRFSFWLFFLLCLLCWLSLFFRMEQSIHSLQKHIFQTHNLYRSQKCIYAFCSVSAFIDVVVTGSMINSNKDVYYTFGISQQLSIVFIHRNAQNCACMLFLIDSPNTVSQSLGVLCGKFAAKFIKLNVITW